MNLKSWQLLDLKWRWGQDWGEKSNYLVRLLRHSSHVFALLQEGFSMILKFIYRRKLILLTKKGSDL
jgi:hypothetical protein